MTRVSPPSVEQFKEMVRGEWTDPLTVAGWSRWAAKQAEQTREATDAIVVAARIGPGQRVLDLACGTGEPALTLAGLVGPTGRVTAADLGPGMLAAAAETARRRGLTNLTFEEADAHDLPFADASFDRVTCRFGVMYFADPVQALSEIRRVLKPGGRAAVVAWGALGQNPFFLLALGPFLKRVALPAPPPGAPHPFRYDQAGSLAADFRAAGFDPVEETERAIELAWPGSPEEIWQYLYDTGVPLHPVFDGLPPDQRSAATAEVIAAYWERFDGTHVRLPGVVVVAAADR